MRTAKRDIGVDVFTAACARISFVFDHFQRIVVSFSGGKDSTLMLHLVCAEARRRGRQVGVLFVDWEAQFDLTIRHVTDLYAEYADAIDPYWVALPLKTTNACSMIEPEWICWEQGRELDWVRRPPAGVITDYRKFDFYNYAMTFEDFVPAFAEWYAQDQVCASCIGIRCDESLDRWRAIMNEKRRFDDHAWTTYKGGRVYNIYPIYDWRTEDIWTFHGKFSEYAHNPLYDLMHRAGLSIHQMRICEPYGDEQRRGLWLYQIIEPETWGKVVARVAGANSAAEHANVAGNILGNRKITLPPGHTWKSFVELLLNTMPGPTAEHYRNKIAVWLNWWFTNGGYTDRIIPDHLPSDTGSTDMPTWRRVCKVILRNDYWCKGLCFSPTKTEAYDRYKKIMQKRRQRWNIW